MDLASLVRAFSTASEYSITRRQKSRFVRGRATDGATSTVTCVASVSPTSPSDLQRLPQGRQFKEAKILITITELKIGDIGGDYEADLIAIGPRSYEVSSLETWVDPSSGNTAYRAVVIDYDGIDR